jgi:hypothetical protein
VEKPRCMIDPAFGTAAGARRRRRSSRSTSIMRCTVVKYFACRPTLLQTATLEPSLDSRLREIGRWRGMGRGEKEERASCSGDWTIACARARGPGRVVPSLHPHLRGSAGPPLSHVAVPCPAPRRGRRSPIFSLSIALSGLVCSDSELHLRLPWQPCRAAVQ